MVIALKLSQTLCLLFPHISHKAFATMEDRRTTILGLNIVLMLLSILAIAARLSTRAFVVKKILLLARFTLYMRNLR